MPAQCVTNHQKEEHYFKLPYFLVTFRRIAYAVHQVHAVATSPTAHGRGCEFPVIHAKSLHGVMYESYAKYKCYKTCREFR